MQKTQQQKQKSKKNLSKNSRLLTTIFRLTPKIIAYARIFSKQLKRKNSHQLTLFPDSVKPVFSPFSQSSVVPSGQSGQIPTPSYLDRNENLINEYMKKTQNWYPFYFSSCDMYIDNRHLDLFQEKEGFGIDIGFGIGKILCFGENVKYTVGNGNTGYRRSQSENGVNMEKKQSNTDINSNQSPSFAYRLSQKLNIPSSITDSLSSQVSTLKSRLMQNISSVMQQKEFQNAEQVILTTNLLFLGTSHGYILIYDGENQKQFCCKWGYVDGSTSRNQNGNANENANKNGNGEIGAILVYKNYVMVKSGGLLGFGKVQKGVEKGKGETIKIKELFSWKVQIGEIYRPSFVRYNELYFVFYIDHKGAVQKLILKQRRIANTISHEHVCQPSIYNPFTNLKIFFQGSQARIIITASCTKQILIFSFNYKQNKCFQLYKLPNPKNPPMNPRTHLFSCIEYLSKFDLNQAPLPQSPPQSIPLSPKRQSQRSSSQSPSPSVLPSPLLEEESLVIAVSFTQRAYFIKLTGNQCELSRRAKFMNRVVKIFSYKGDGIIFVLYKDRKQAKSEDMGMEMEIGMRIGRSEEKNQDKNRLIIIATLVKQIMSFKLPLHTQIINKIQYQYILAQTPTNISNQNFKASFAIINNQILILTQTKIARIAFSTWLDIYRKMHRSENVQLLKFLLLLSNYASTYLTPPPSLASLQLFFPSQTMQTKQILLEYYFQQKITPPETFMSHILQKPQILLPFILEHKIQNLSQNTKQILIQYWKNKDERIIEELIMAGCEFGWEIAIKKGWMRSLRKIVSMGMEVHFPLLKLSSFVVKELGIMEEMERNGGQGKQRKDKEEEDSLWESLERKVQMYCGQMVQYGLLALEYFLAPEEIQELDDLKQFLLILFRSEIYNNCIKFKPNESVKLISKLFSSQQRIYLIDKLQIEDFVHLQKQFRHIVRTNYLSVSQSIFSYMSQVFYELTQTKVYTNDQKCKFRQLLSVQHAKILRLEMENRISGPNFSNPNPPTQFSGIFQFTRPYLLQMLINLAAHNNENLKILIHDTCISLELNRETHQSYMQDLLVKIYLDSKSSPIDFESPSIPNLEPKQIRDLIAVHEQINNSNNYLLICLMAELPVSEYCTKILRKFVYCQNSVIRQRIFNWLGAVMQNSEWRAILEAELMNHLKAIIEIDKEKSRGLFEMYFRSREREIIGRIDNDPHLQLEYLEMIIREAIENQTQVEEFYLNLYLKLLINEQPERVVDVLEEASKNQTKYDLQQALRVSLQKQSYNQKHRIQMYLYQKIGQIQKCISSYLKILEQLFWQYIDNNESNPQPPPSSATPSTLSTPSPQQYTFTQKSSTSKKLSLISQLISHKLTSQSDTRRQQLQQQISQTFKQLTDLIFRQQIQKYQYIKIIFNSMLDFWQKIKSEKFNKKNMYISMIGFYFGRIIVQCFQRDCFGYFCRWLREGEMKIDFNAIRKYLYEGYGKLIAYQVLLGNISDIDRTVLLQNIGDTLGLLENPIYCQSKCPVCSNSFTSSSSQTLLFNCGHLYHQKCIEPSQSDTQQDYCLECIWNNQIKAMIDHSQINMVEMIQKYCQKKSNRNGMPLEQQKKQPIVSRGKKIMNRFGIFDKKVGAIENQAEIIQMRLEILDYYVNLKNEGE